MSETACACYKVEEIPAPSAKASYSCACFRQSLGRLLCISKLSETFGFNQEDLLINKTSWNPTYISIVDGKDIDPVSDDDGNYAICGGDVSNNTGAFISFISSALKIADNRVWMSSLCAGSSETPTLLYGPVTPPYHALNALAVPPFVPASASSGGRPSSSTVIADTYTMYCIGKITSQPSSNGAGKAKLFTVNSSGELEDSDISVNVKGI